MSRSNAMRNMRSAVVLLAVAAAGCAGGEGSASVGYSYGAYYGDPWGMDYYYAGGPIYVGPPDVSPPPANRPPHVSHLPARPMPAPRPMSGGGRRR